MFKRFFPLFCLCCSLSCLAAQEASKPDLPLVFELGTYEEDHMLVDSLITQTLIGASRNDFEKARDAWVDLLEDMEAYAEEIDYPLEGIKVFLHLYCDPKGNILHLGYLPAPESRFLPEGEMRAFFSSFVRHHQFPLVAESRRAYKYNSKVSFPLYPRLVSQTKQ